MTFSIARMLVHSKSVPDDAREALKVALEAAPEQRHAFLERVVELLYKGTDLECSEARELVGLAPCGSCCA